MQNNCLPRKWLPAILPAPKMYSLDEYGEMINDGARTGAYAKAIERAVRPGDVVVDIGCGVGIFALLACRAGARRVYAIESGEIVQWGRQLAAANGFSNRIEFFQGDSREIQLPERADVVVSDLRGALPFYGEAIASIEDARQRFLAPGGVQIPQNDTLYAAVVDAAETYGQLTSPWRDSLRGLDLSSLLVPILSATYNGRFEQSNLLTESKRWCTLDYTAGAKTHSAAKIRLHAVREGVAHGICLWFETTLYEEIAFSSSPALPETVYGRFFLPWLEPVTLRAGQEIDVELRADCVTGKYIWRWNTAFPAENGKPRREFRQSTFQSVTLSPETMRRRSAEFLPQLSERGHAQEWILTAMDGKTCLEEIARSATKRFPKAFRDWEEAFRVASDLSSRFAR